MDINFANLKELKQRITPAIKTKIKEFKNNNYINIKEEIIWEYLKNKKWKKATNLTLYDIINDIINLKIEDIEEYKNGSGLND